MHMFRRLTAGLIVAALLALSVASVQAQEAPIPIAPGEEASGTLADSTQQYVMSLTAGQVVAVQIFSEDFEPAASIDNAEGREVVFDFGNETTSAVVMIAPADGDYFINVGEFMGATTGAYTVEVQDAAGELAPDTPTAGNMDYVPQAYVINGAAGTLVSATLNAEGYDAELRLVDASNEELAQDSQFGSDPAVVEFVLPADGQYVLVSDLYFAADAFQGTFEIAYSAIIPNPIEYDASAVVSMAGTARQYYAFGGNAGDVIHIVADSGATAEEDGSIDVDLAVTGPEGFDVFTDRSDGIGFDPAITRVRLPADGFYLIKIIPNDESDEAQAGDVTLSVETAELITVDDGPVSVTLGDADRFEQDFVRFTGEPGQAYRLTVVGDRPTISFNVTVGEGLFSSINTTVSNGDQIVFDFTLPEDIEAGSIVDISLRQSAFQNPTTYEISLEPLN